MVYINFKFFRLCLTFANWVHCFLFTSKSESYNHNSVSISMFWIVHVSVLSIFRLREWRGFHITKQITSELSHVMPADLYTHHTTPTPTQHMKWGGGGGGMGMLCIWMHVTVTSWYVFFITVYLSRYFTVPHDEYVNSAHIVSHHTHDPHPHYFSSYTWLKFLF